MAFGGVAGFWDPNLHPRGWHGRFIRKFKLAPWLDDTLKKFRPRTFQSNGQAAQFGFNMGHKSPAGAFSELSMRRVHLDWDEASDHLRNNDLDPTTQKFVQEMDPHFQPAPPGGLILSRTLTPEGLGLRPEQLNEDDPQGITSMMGNTIADKAYGATHLGTNDSHGPGKITMSIAVPEGTRVAYSGQNPNDRGVFLDKGQKLLVTRVYPDEQGGWFMTAVAEPPNATSGSPVSVVEGRKGAGLSELQREARINGTPSVMRQPAEPPRGDSTGHNLNIPGERVEPAQVPARTPEQQAAKASRAARYQQIRQTEEANGGVPQGATPPPQAPQPVQPQPTPPSGVGERTEPVHGPIGGVSTEGKSASEIAATPPEAPSAPTATGIQEGPAPTATFRQAFHDAGLEYPSSGAQRSEVNKALLPVMNGKGHPQDALRMLESDIKHNERHVQDLQPDSPQARDMHDNIDKQRKIADFMAQHFNLPREGKAEKAPEAPTPEAPAKKAFSSVKELSPEERASYDKLDRLGRTRYLARRRAGQEHGAAFEGAKGTGKAAPAKAAPEPRKGLTTAGQESPNALPPLHTAKAEAPAAPAAPVREKPPGTAEGKITTGRLQKGDKIVVTKRADGTYAPSTRKTGGTILTVDRVDTQAPAGGSVYRRARSNRAVHGVDENGNQVSVYGIPAHQTFWEHKEKAPRATKAVPAKAVEKVSEAPSKSTAAKVAKAAPAAKAVSEVQTRADEAGLPKTVTALRQAAREKKIRGFSTMNKEQLQRALLGEEVGTGGKLGAIAPDKLTGHIQAAATDQAARNLMEDHTVADLKALAKHNDVNLKGITTKDRIKDAIIKHLRGEGEGALRPTPPTESLLEGMAHNKILAAGLGKEPDIQSIVAKVNDADPDSLRSHRDELEKIAEDTKTSDPIRSRIAQEAADAMGMRAQQISGVEEAPTAKKAAKVAKKAAAPKLSVHQERVRKQALADGATEEEARAAGEAAPVRAPAGTKAATAKAAKARKEAGLPESRQAQFERTGEFNPGPQQTVPKRAPKAAAKPKAGMPEGPGTEKPQGVRETAAPGDLLSPESTRKLRAAGMEPGVPGRGRIQSRDLKPGDRVMVERDSEGQLVPEMVRGDKAAFPVDVVKQNPDGSVQVKDGEGNLHNTVPEAPRGTSYRPETPTEARRAAQKAAKTGVPAQTERKLKAAGTSSEKLVPNDSVPGERAQVPIVNEARQGEFDKAYKEFQRKTLRRTGLTQGTTKSQDEIANDVSRGHITPEEGIRRAESEIEINNSEIQDIARTIRRGDLSEPEIAKLRGQRDQLARDNVSNEQFSKFLHGHFGKERVTVPEVKQSIAKNLGLNVGEMLKGTDAQSLKDLIHNDPNMAHLGEIKGNTGEEVFDNALKAMITHHMNEIAAEKEGKKVAKVAKAAPRKAAVSPPPAGKPEFEPGGAKHLDAKAIAGDLGIPDDTLKHTQGELNAGKTPGQAADTLRRHAQGIRDHAALVGLGRSDEELAKMDPEGLKTRNERLDQAAKMDELANRLKATRRPIVRKTAATKATEEIAQAKEVTKEPAAKKALAKAGTAADEARVEADKLKDRIVGRHREAWEKSTSVKEAEAAGEAMRKDLTLGEIRQFFDGQGIRGRTKDDILKKAIERRFGSGGDISPERVTSPAQLAKVNNRFEEANRLKQAGSGFANIDEILANGGSERAVRHRVDTAGFNPEETARIRQAALAGDRTELDRIAQEHGLTRNTGAPGDIEPFEPGKHRAITGSHRKGDAVRVIQPGYQGTVEGRAFQAHPATVLQATPEEKQAMLTRLANDKNEAIKNLPAETRAAVLARVHRQGQNPVAKKAAARARAAKGIAEPEPLPTNKEVEVAQNMERLNAAKAVKPSGDLKTSTKAELFKIAENENIPVKKTSTKADLISSIETWRNRPAEAVAGRGFEGNRPETGVATRPSALEATKARTAERAAKAANPVTSTGAPEHGKLEGAALANAPLPQRGPIKRAHVRFDETTSPATFGREDGNTPLRAPNGSWSSDQGLIHMDSEIGQLWQDLAKDNRLPNSDLNKITVIGQQLAKGDINLNQAGAELNGIRNGLTDGPIKDRFTQTVSALGGPKAPEVHVPDNTPASVKEWLQKVADTPTFNKHRPGQSGTAFEELQDLVREVSEGNRPLGAETKLGGIGNVHESTDGYYALRREAGKVFSTPEARKWFMTRPTAGQPEAKAPEAPKAPAKAAKAAKKVAAPRVTQAELRNPVEKVGAAAPSATPSQIQAKGLTPGEGVPTGPLLAARNKLGPGNSGTLTKLDTAVRIPARHSDIPGLLRDLQEQLQRAGVGPNDEPRKSLVAWFKEHFKF